MENSNHKFKGKKIFPKGYCHCFLKFGACRDDACQFKHEYPEGWSDDEGPYNIPSNESGNFSNNNGMHMPQFHKNLPMQFRGMKPVDIALIPKGFCHFWVKNGYCRNENNCNFKHETPPAELMQAKAREPQPPKGYCHFWMKKGYCKNDSCMFKHERPPESMIPFPGNLLNEPEYLREEDIEDVDECPEFIKEGCCNKFRSCPHFHPEVECEYWVEYGYCKERDFDRCNLQHRTRWKRPVIFPNPEGMMKPGGFGLLSDDTIGKIKALLFNAPAGIPLDVLSEHYRTAYGEFLFPSPNIPISEVDKLLCTVGDFKIKQQRTDQRLLLTLKSDFSERGRRSSRSRSRSYHSRSRSRSPSRRRRRRSRSRSLVHSAHLFFSVN